MYINYIRRFQNEAQIVPFDVSEYSEADAQSQVERGLVIRDLAAALARLSEEQRQVLLLAGLEHMSYAAIARILDIPEGTVMSRFRLCA